jgi:hypothetical protein
MIYCVYNTTFSNISAISRWPVLVVEEAEVTVENHRPWTSNWWTLSLVAASRVHPFCKLQSRGRTHAVLAVGLYELLGIPTTKLIEPPGPLIILNETLYPYFWKKMFKSVIILLPYEIWLKVSLTP